MFVFSNNCYCYSIAFYIKIIHKKPLPLIDIYKNKSNINEINNQSNQSNQININDMKRQNDEMKRNETKRNDIK